jgi:DNA-binding protein
MAAANLSRSPFGVGFDPKNVGRTHGVILSFIGKVETGERCLDIAEFVRYCQALELNPSLVLEEFCAKLEEQHPPMMM